ncbi:MAG: hypothetical protein PF487_10430, partial [Bacteroidales bacterium]|nr:hypothetical protein [Bacteroidales bacterium]
KNLVWVSNDSSVYLVAEGSGNIYEFKGNSIIRLENSYDQRSNCASTYFMYRNSIFNFSGYGYWQYPSFISKYDLRTNKIAAYITQDGTLVPPSKVKPLSLFNAQENLLYVWGGAKIGFSNLIPGLINNTNELWNLNLVSGNWNKMGKIKMPKVFSNISISDTFITFNSDNKLFCLLEKQLIEFDILNDKLSTFKIEDDFDFNIDAKIKPAYSEASNLILLSTIPFPNQNIRRVQFVSLANYKTTLISETTLYKMSLNNIIKYIILFVVLLVLAFLLYYLYKNYFIYRNKLIFNRSTKSIKFNNKTISILDEEEADLLFWFAQSKDFVTTNSIMDRLTQGSQNYESMKKRKLSIMNAIDFKLGALLHVKDSVFHCRKSKEDLRLKECKLNPEWVIVRE